MKKIISLMLCLLLSLGVIEAFAAEKAINKDASWTVTATSEHSEHPAADAFDSDTKTYWHTNYEAEGGAITKKDENPFAITVDFGKEISVSGWRYTPRQDNATGTVRKYGIYSSTDGKSFKKIYDGAFSNYQAAKDATVNKPEKASWGDVKMRAIKIEITESIGKFGSAAEIEFFTGGTGKTNADGESYVETKKEDTASEVKKSTSYTPSGTPVKKENNWRITATSEYSEHPVADAFDSDIKTYWHTNYEAEGGSITKKDENPFEIVVNFGKEINISGWRYTPRQDNATGTIKKYSVYSSTNGTKFTKIYDGAFPDYQAAKDATVNQPGGASWGDVKMRAIKIEITESIGKFGSAAEIEFYTGGEKDKMVTDTPGGDKNDSAERTAADGTALLSKTGWKAEVNSVRPDYPAENMLDSNVKTYWHSNYEAEGTKITKQDNPPYDIYITLPEKKTVSGIILTPRKDHSAGRIQGANIYVSDSDNGEWFLLGDKLEFEDNDSPQEIKLSANLDIKRVRVEITSGYSGFGSLAEFDLIDKKDDLKTVSYSEYKAIEDERRLYEIDRKGFTAEYDGANWESFTPDKVLNGNLKSFWQTDALGFGDYPVQLIIDMKDVYAVSEITYTPRQSKDLHGCWLKVKVWASTDGDDWFIIRDSMSLPKDLSVKKITLDSETEMRYVMFEIEESAYERVSACEIRFYQSKAAHDAKGTEKYVLKIGSNTITSEKHGTVKNTEIDVAPFIRNGSTMIPLRGLLEEMGANITWNGENKRIGIDDGIYKIDLGIWDYLVYVEDPVYGNIRYTLLNPPVLKDSRTFVPIRFISEQLGYNVSWDAETQTVTITE